MQRFKILLLVLGAFVFGFLSTNLVTYVLAHGGNLNFIHACVGTGVLNQGRVRIISASGTCNANEAPLDWAKLPWNSDFPLMCQNCDLTSGVVGNLFVGKDLSNAFLIGSHVAGTDFRGATFAGAHLGSLDASNANFHGVDLSNTDLTSSGFNSADLSGANLSGNNSLPGVSFSNANLSDSNLSNANFTSTNLTGTNLLNANFSNTNLTGADLRGATGFNTANRTGIIYSNTLCPDGTNSDNNGNTCEGHLTP